MTDLQPPLSQPFYLWESFRKRKQISEQTKNKAKRNFSQVQSGDEREKKVLTKRGEFRPESFFIKLTLQKQKNKNAKLIRKNNVSKSSKTKRKNEEEELPSENNREAENSDESESENRKKEITVVPVTFLFHGKGVDGDAHLQVYFHKPLSCPKTQRNYYGFQLSYAKKRHIFALTDEDGTGNKFTSWAKKAQLALKADPSLWPTFRYKTDKTPFSTWTWEHIEEDDEFIPIYKLARFIPNKKRTCF